MRDLAKNRERKEAKRKKEKRGELEGHIERGEIGSGSRCTNPRSILTSNAPVSDSNHRNAFHASCRVLYFRPPNVLPSGYPFVRACVRGRLHTSPRCVTVCSCACLQPEPRSSVIAKGLQVRIKRGFQRYGH